MKNQHPGIVRSIALSFLSFVVLSYIFIPSAAAETFPNLSKQELKALLATAKTPADHARLAAYYRDKAQHLRKQEEELSAQAAALATQATAVEGKCTRTFLSKQGASCNSASHFRYFAQECAKRAQAAEELAAQQSQLSQSGQAAQTQN